MTRVVQWEEGMRATAAARTRLVEIYGTVPCVVYCIQRGDNGPVKIGYALRIAGRVANFYNASPTPIAVRAVIPGERALEAWFHRRNRERHMQGEWYDDAEAIVADAREFGDLHARAFGGCGDRTQATVAVICAVDPFIRDLHRLYSNGATVPELAKLTGMEPMQVRRRLESLRSLGFDIPRRRMYAPRGKPSPRFEVPLKRGGRRFIG